MNKEWNIIDVGASIGLFSTFIASRQNQNKSVNVIAVEPLLVVANRIPKLPNIHVVPKALSSANHISDSGTRTFQRFEASELSSFLKVNSEIDLDLYIEHIPSLKLVEIMEVPAITLRQLILENDLQRVDFVKIDAQGADLEIILSAGDCLPRVMSFVLEAPYTNASSIYEHEPILMETILKMEEQGFLLVRITPNGSGEANIFFVNLSFGIHKYLQLEKELEFAKAPTLKIGVHDADLSYLTKKTFARKAIEKIKYESNKKMKQSE